MQSHANVLDTRTNLLIDNPGNKILYVATQQDKKMKRNENTRKNWNNITPSMRRGTAVALAIRPLS